LNESIFNTEIVNSIRKLNYWAYKIPDIPHIKDNPMRFTPPKPYDIEVKICGKATAVESKQMKKLRLPFH